VGPSSHLTIPEKPPRKRARRATLPAHTPGAVREKFSPCGVVPRTGRRPPGFHHKTDRPRPVSAFRSGAHHPRPSAPERIGPRSAASAPPAHLRPGIERPPSRWRARFVTPNPERKTPPRVHDHLPCPVRHESPSSSDKPDAKIPHEPATASDKSHKGVDSGHCRTRYLRASPAHITRSRAPSCIRGVYRPPRTRNSARSEMASLQPKIAPTVALLG